MDNQNNGGEGGEEGGEQQGANLDTEVIDSIRNMVESGPEIQNLLRDNTHFGAGNAGGGDSSFNVMPDRW